MAYEKTLKIVTNLDRGAIEAKIAEIRDSARSSQLAELVSLLSGVEGLPRAQVEARVKSALKWLADKPQHNSLRARLELVELNLPNLEQAACEQGSRDRAPQRRLRAPAERRGSGNHPRPRARQGGQ